MPGGLHPPLAAILAFPTPNYINPETRPDIPLLLACILGPITILMLFLRLWVRIFHQRNPGWDDWLMLAASIPTIALTVIYPLAGSDGLNRHIWDINVLGDPGKVVRSRKYILAIESIFCIASGLIKISILLFYRRLSSRVVSRTFKWVTWITIGFIASYSIALTIVPILGCQPISAFWDQADLVKILQGYKFHCFDEGADVVAASVISAAQDLITAVLPTFLYWNLRIPTRQKVALFGVFAIGYGVVALGILRAYYSWRTFYNTYDVTWSTWDIILASMLELHIGSFCANAPAAKFFFAHFLIPHIKSTGTGKSSTVWGRFTSFLSTKSSRSGKGYTSDSRTTAVSVAPRTDRNPSTASTDMLYDHHYYKHDEDDDIELGRYTSKSYDGSDLTAVPPLSEAHKSARLFKYPQAHPPTPATKELPRIPLPVLTAEDCSAIEVNSTPVHTRNASQMEPKVWKPTWS